MSNRSISVLLAAGIVIAVTHLLATRLVASEEANSEKEVRQAVEKSLPYIEEKGLYWIEKKKCVSCHRVSFMTWSLSSAARRGFDVDLEKVNEWIDWSIHKGIPNPDGEKTVATKNADGLSQQLIARAEYPADETRDEVWSNYVDLILNMQRDDGLWKPAGQLPGQKRKLAETTDVSAVWHTVALTRGTGVGERLSSAGNAEVCTRCRGEEIERSQRSGKYRVVRREAVARVGVRR